METQTRYVNLSSGEILSFSVATGDSYLASTRDAATISEAIQHGTVACAYRIYLLFADETVDREIPREDIKLGASYSENYQNGQRRTLSFSLYNDDGKYTPNANVLRAGTRIRLDLGVTMVDNSTIWFTKGVYVVESVTVSHTPTGSSVDVSCGDKFALLESSVGRLTMSYEIPSGTPIVDAIKTILLSDTGNGTPFDPKKPIVHSSLANKTTQAKIQKAAGDTFGSILMDLCTQANAEMFYNASGSLTLIPTSDVTEDDFKPLLCSFSAENGDIGSISFGVGYSDIVNQVIVIGQNPSGGDCQAVAVNADPRSPFCYQRVGYRTAQMIQDSNISSYILARDRANYELRQMTILRSTASATVPFNPLLEVNNVVIVNDPFLDMANERFLLQSVSCSLDYGNQMNISFTNLKNLPFLGR